MAKAVKLKNDMYLDTRGSVHNGTILNNYLDGLNTRITNNTNSINGINTSISGINSSLNSVNSEISGIKTQKLLWQGVMYMHGTQSINLPEPISEQTNGICLVFCGYSNGSARDYNFSVCFIPKMAVELKEGVGFWFSMGDHASSVVTKYIYIHNNRLEGNANNSGDGFVLRYVIGV